MISTFYLLSHSFQFPENISIRELENRIKDFSVDCEYIRKNDSDQIFIHDSVYEVEIFPNLSTMDLMYDRSKNKDFDKDTLEYLRIIIEKSEQTILQEEEIKNLLPQHSENQIFALLCLHKTNFAQEKYLVYNAHNWLVFHRYFLGIYPKNNIFFFSECKKYFPNLFFHERNQQTISKILFDFAQKIVFHLACLHDHFKEIRQNHKFLPDALKTFSITYKLDEQASLEGDLNRKKDLEFDFLNDEKKLEKICCEPHLKLCRNDKDQDYFYYRIYFHEGKKNISNGQILIGHIGEHL
ncbi:MAG: hypothetical protein EAZ97_11480 [Bacteroidetes bacterium]|nr:MAG: hypothetical protein EAZ97_11480 [Bacteroidota bacterium]